MLSMCVYSTPSCLAIVCIQTLKSAGGIRKPLGKASTNYPGSKQPPILTPNTLESTSTPLFLAIEAQNRNKNLQNAQLGL